MKTADTGSVITKDHAVAILISLSSFKEYSGQVFPLLIKQIEKAPGNQLPMYAERIAPVVNENTQKNFVKVLLGRLPTIEKDTKRKRVEKIIQKFS